MNCSVRVQTIRYLGEQLQQIGFAIFKIEMYLAVSQTGCFSCIAYLMINVKNILTKRPWKGKWPSQKLIVLKQNSWFYKIVNTFCEWGVEMVTNLTLLQHKSNNTRQNCIQKTQQGKVAARKIRPLILKRIKFWVPLLRAITLKAKNCN